MRAGGPSVLGDYHYLPARLCRHPGELTTLPVELCCFADMLEKVQGLRAPEIIQITDPDSDMPHIHRREAAPFMDDYYALKDSFQRMQARFDPRQPPPDPTGSQHYGRWARFAHKLLARQAGVDPSA
jgi:uncharacterized protein